MNSNGIPDDSVRDKVLDHVDKYKRRYSTVALVTSATVGAVIGYRVARNPAWTFTGINYKPTFVTLPTLPKTVSYGKNVVDAAEHIGLKTETVADLFKSGWTYLENIEPPLDLGLKGITKALVQV